MKNQKEEKKNEKKMVKKHMTLRKRRAPAQMTLPNGRSFTSRWERIIRKQLPINIKVAKSRTKGPRRKRNVKASGNRKLPAWMIRKHKRIQSGSGLGDDLIKTGISLGSKALGSDIGKKIINKGIDNIPNIFRFGRSKVKNNNIKKALESEIADLVVREAQNKVRKKYDSNDLIEKNGRIFEHSNRESV